MAPIIDPSYEASVSEQSAEATSAPPPGSQPGTDCHTRIHSAQQWGAGEDYNISYPAVNDMASGVVWTFPSDGDIDNQDPESCTLPGIDLPFPLSYKDRDIRSRHLESDTTDTEEISVAKKPRLSASLEETCAPQQAFELNRAANTRPDSAAAEHEMDLQEFMADPVIDPEDPPSAMFESFEYLPPSPKCEGDHEGNHENCVKVADLDKSLMVRESEETGKVYNAIMNKKKKLRAERAARNPQEHRHRDPKHVLQEASKVLSSFSLTAEGHVHPRHMRNYDDYDHDYHKIQ